MYLNRTQPLNRVRFLVANYRPLLHNCLSLVGLLRQFPCLFKVLYYPPETCQTCSSLTKIPHSILSSFVNKSPKNLNRATSAFLGFPKRLIDLFTEPVKRTNIFLFLAPRK